jgi:hypothetical protein
MRPSFELSEKIAASPGLALEARGLRRCNLDIFPNACYRSMPERSVFFFACLIVYDFSSPGWRRSPKWRTQPDMRMTKRMISLLILAPTALLSGACSESETPAVEAPMVVLASVEAVPAAGQFIAGEIVETMDAAGYTYVLVDTGDQKVWAAGPQTAVKVGDNVALANGMAMTDFHSQTLDRTFEVVYFVGSINGGDGAAAAPQGSAIRQEIPAHGTSPEKAAPQSTIDLSNIQKVSGGKTIAELFADAEELADQEVSVRGRVVKFNAGIMGRNWIHIQDGSGSEGSNDLTVTTEDTAQLGDLVVIRGRLKTNQDFGHGYSYDLLLEQSEVDVE